MKSPMKLSGKHWSLQPRTSSVSQMPSWQSPPSYSNSSQFRAVSQTSLPTQFFG